MRALLGGICFLLLTCSFSQANDAGALFASVNARLSLMKPVAAWKLDKHVAVEDLAREKVVLDKAVSSAEELGINAASTRAFFQAQIEAAKEIQRCWINRWQSGAAPKMTEYPDLKTEIRPDLIRLGREILVRFKAVLSDQSQVAPSDQTMFDDTLKVDCLSPQAALPIFQAMQSVRLNP